MKLVIVESPAKCSKIQSYLGKGFKVMASYGHIRDLSKKGFGIDLATMTPHYQIMATKSKQINALKAEASKADEVIIASDYDREGEAIGYHVAKVLGLDPTKTKRIVFHEITKTAIQTAINNPTKLDINLFNAQQCRRILDRLVGFEVSPLLWKNIRASLSAGRCQTPALRVIYDNEKKRQEFSEEWKWDGSGKFRTEGGIELDATLKKKLVKEKEDAFSSYMLKCSKNNFVVTSIVKKQSKHKPPPPFITSTLQQVASNVLRFTPKTTMAVAQTLYEKGFITYMRTDSVCLSKDIVSVLCDIINSKYGKANLQVRDYKSKKNSQEAHEAIRPTNPTMTSDNTMTNQEEKLYKLIYQRTLASQMKDETKEQQIIVISDGSNNFQASHTRTIDPGYQLVYGNSDSTKELDVKEGEKCKMLEFTIEQSYNSPPSHLNESGLVKELESLGIGRPSTYSNLVETIKTREYVVIDDVKGKSINRKVYKWVVGSSTIRNDIKETKLGEEKKKLVLTPIGKTVIEYLYKSFNELFDYKYTATIEDMLDGIAEGNENWKEVIKRLYNEFHPIVEKCNTLKPTIEKTANIIGEHEGKLVEKNSSKFGPFIRLLDPTTQNEIEKIYPKKEFNTVEDIIEFLPTTIDNIDGYDVVLKNGRYGYYIEWNSQRMALKSKDDIPANIKEAFGAKVSNQKKVLKTINKVNIVEGPYGPYYVWNKGFIGISKDKIDSMNTMKDLEEHAKEFLENKKKGGRFGNKKVVSSTKDPKMIKSVNSNTTTKNSTTKKTVSKNKTTPKKVNSASKAMFLDD